MKIRVFLADDHPVARMGVRAVLNSADDFEVVGEAAEGEGALQRLLELRPDVAVLDLKLPGLTALEILGGLRAQEVKLRVLVLTGQGTVEAAREAKALGAWGFLHKDTSAPALLHAVRELSRGRPVWTREQLDAFRAAAAVPSLSPRELQILQALATGATNKELAAQLGISDGTVRIHVSNIFAKLDVDDRTAAVTLGLKRGLIDLT